MASIKIERAHVVELARALSVPVHPGESGAALFRRCLERAQLLNERARELVDASNADELAALKTVGRALVASGLGGRGEETATNGTAARPAEPAGC